MIINESKSVIRTENCFKESTYSPSFDGCFCSRGADRSWIHVGRRRLGSRPDTSGKAGPTRYSEGDTTTSRLFVLFAREKNKQIDVMEEQASARGQEAGIMERRLVRSS